MWGRHQGGCGGYIRGKRGGTDFPAKHTLLQVCHHVERSTCIARYGMWVSRGEERINVRQTSRGVRGTIVENVEVQIFQLNILCYKYAIMWLLSSRCARHKWHRKGCRKRYGEDTIGVGQRSRGVGGGTVGKTVKVLIFLARHIQLQVCHHVAAVVIKKTIISAWWGVWMCSGEEIINVRQTSRGVWRVQ